MRALLGVVLLFGCGDPRAPFVGNYRGSGERTTYFASGPPDVSTGPISFTLTAPERSNKLAFSGTCKFTAEVIDSDIIQLDAAACPSRSGTSTGGATATYQFSFDIGTGTLSGKTLTINQDGDEFGSNYSDGSPNAHYRIHMRTIVSQQ